MPILRSTELSNIEVAESLLKFVVDRLNNPPEHQNEEYQQQYLKQQMLAAYLCRLIFHQTSHLKKKSNKEKLIAITVENRVSLLMNTLKNSQFKQSLLENTLPRNIAADIPKLPSNNSKKENEALLTQLLHFSIQPLFTPAFNQKWFETISTIINKYQLNQNTLTSKLKQATNLNEINRVAKSNLKAEQKLNSLIDILHDIKPTEENFASIRDLINRYIEQILHEQLLKEIQGIVTTQNMDNPTKLKQIYFKICKGDGDIVNYIIDEALRESALTIAKPFMQKLEEAIISEIEQAKDNDPFTQIVMLNQLITKMKNVSPDLCEILTNKKNAINEQIALTIDKIIADTQMTVYQKIEDINTLLGNNFTDLSPQVKKALRIAKIALRKNINHEIEKIFVDNNLSSYNKFKQILIISKMMETGSGLPKSFIAAANSYMKILIGKEISEFAIRPEQSTLQRLEILNDLTIRAHHLNIFDEKLAANVKKHNYQLLWKIACEIDLLNRQNFISEPSLVIPADITKFKLAGNAFAKSQNSTDAITKSFVAYILSSKDNDEACLKIEQTLIIAKHLLYKGSIDSFLALLSALNNGAIIRLKSAINGLSPQARKLFEDFNTIADANGNFPALRKVEVAAAQSGINLVPSIVILSKDLTNAAENPEKSQDAIIKLVTHFNSHKEKIQATLTKKTGNIFQADKALDEPTAYQYSEKLEPKNVQPQIPSIISTLHTLVIPHKKRAFDINIKKIVGGESTHVTTTAGSSPDKGKENTNIINRSSRSVILFTSANQILRSSSSYIAKVLAASADEVNVDTTKNNSSTARLTIEPAKPTLPIYDAPKIQQPKIAMPAEAAKQEKNQPTGVMATLNNIWKGIWGFVSLDITPHTKPVINKNQHNREMKEQTPAELPLSNNTKQKERTKSSPEYEAWSQARQATDTNKPTQKYSTRLFPANRTRLRQPPNHSDQEVTSMKSRSVILRSI